MKTKKGDIWVSAILYFGLGIVIIGIILAAFTPVINRLRDKNIIVQTKGVFQVLDSNIREVAREGSGAQRPLTIDIRKGEFKIDNDNHKIIWTYPSKALLAEPCTDPLDPAKCPSILEGNVKIIVNSPSPLNKNYLTELSLEYTDKAYLHYTSPLTTIAGNTPLVIRNSGVSCGPQGETGLSAGPYGAPVKDTCTPPSCPTLNWCTCLSRATTALESCPPALPTVEIVQRSA